MEIHQCRDSFGYLNASIFQIWSCSLCYTFLFQQKVPLTFNMNPEDPKLIFRNNSRYSSMENTSFIADMFQQENMDRICDTLEQTTDCDRWKSCCKAADACCSGQSNVNSSAKLDPDTCPGTWDGFGCFKETPAGSTSNILCPDYIEYGFSTGYGKKFCTENGTWWRDPTSKREWTDYTPCLDLKMYKAVVYVGLVCSGLSILLLIPACVIFMGISQLRSQQRIRLHFCLFLSFLLTSIVNILWDYFVYGDRLDNQLENTVIYQHTLYCRVLYFFLRYTRTSNHFWMFCEGFYLHRLMVQAFKVPKTLTSYYVFGWGIALIPASVYLIIKTGIANYGCWVKNIGYYEWIVYTPNLLCILANMVFLGSILRILITQLQSHPNEPSNYRRALKATCVLIPLFGIQLFLIIYRPHSVSTNLLYYEITSKVIIDSQGAVISLIFCYLSGEVHTHLKCQFRSILHRYRRNEKITTPSVSLTQYSTVPARPIWIGKRQGKNSRYIGMKKFQNGNGTTKQFVPGEFVFS